MSGLTRNRPVLRPIGLGFPFDATDRFTPECELRVGLLLDLAKVRQSPKRPVRDGFGCPVELLHGHLALDTLFVAEGRCHRPNHDDLVHTAAPREATADLDVHASAPPSTRDRNDSGRSRSALSTPAQISA